MEFDWGSLLGTGANALASYYGGKQINQAGQAAQQAADPYGPYRQVAATRLEGLQANPSSVANLPGYQFGMQQGQQALERSGAAQGYLGSGNMLAALQNQAQGYAGQQYDKERLFQAGLAGANFNNSAQGAQFGYQGASNQAQQNQNALTGMASGLFGQGGAGSSLMNKGAGSAGNYLSDLYAKNYGAGSGASGGTAGSVGGGPMSQTYDASGISGGVAETGGLVPGYTAAGQGYALPGTAGSEGLMYGGDIGADAAYGAGAGAGGSSATGATSYNALASAAEGAEGASAAAGSGSGAGAGYAGLGASAGVIALGAHLYNKAGETNEAQVGTLVSDVGGPSAFIKQANQQIDGLLDPKNYQSILDSGITHIQGLLNNPTEGADNRNAAMTLGLRTPDDVANYIVKSVVNGGGVLGMAMNPKFDPAILGKEIGSQTANDLKNRYIKATEEMYPKLLAYIKSQPGFSTGFGAVDFSDNSSVGG